MKKLLLQIAAVLGVFIAATSMAGACFVWSYQPKVPAKLLKR